MLQSQTTIKLNTDIAETLYCLAKQKETDVNGVLKEALNKKYFIDKSEENISSKKRTASDVVESIKKHRRVISDINYKELINAGRKY
jgi:hypothetical protein